MKRFTHWFNNVFETHLMEWQLILILTGYGLVTAFLITALFTIPTPLGN